MGGVEERYAGKQPLTVRSAIKIPFKHGMCRVPKRLETVIHGIWTKLIIGPS